MPSDSFHLDSNEVLADIAWVTPLDCRRGYLNGQGSRSTSPLAGHQVICHMSKGFFFVSNIYTPVRDGSPALYKVQSKQDMATVGGKDSLRKYYISKYRDSAYV